MCFVSWDSENRKIARRKYFFVTCALITENVILLGEGSRFWGTRLNPRISYKEVGVYVDTGSDPSRMQCGRPSSATLLSVAQYGWPNRGHRCGSKGLREGRPGSSTPGGVLVRIMPSVIGLDRFRRCWRDPGCRSSRHARPCHSRRTKRGLPRPRSRRLPSNSGTMRCMGVGGWQE